jgi:pyroglutamyl-peptidase
MEIRVLSLPTVFDRAWPTLESTLDSVRDRLGGVFTLGVAVQRDRMDLEAVARNRRSLTRIDAEGRTAATESIRRRGPAELHVGFDPATTVATLIDAGHAFRASTDAGDYLCNEIFYQTLAWQRREGFVGPAGFIHVPSLETIPLRQSAEGVAALLALLSGTTPATTPR